MTGKNNGMASSAYQILVATSTDKLNEEQADLWNSGKIQSDASQGIVYQGKDYQPGSALTYLEKSIERNLMHPETQRQLIYILTMLRDKGEKKTFRYLRKSVLAGKPFPWEKREESE